MDQDLGCNSKTKEDFSSKDVPVSTSTCAGHSSADSKSLEATKSEPNFQPCSNDDSTSSTVLAVPVDSDSIQVSNSCLKLVMDTFEMYLADKRSVQMKRQLSSGIFQVLNNLCSEVEKAEKVQIGDMCGTLLANETKNLSLIYDFLGEIFRALPGGIDALLANSLLSLHSLLSLWTHCDERLSVSIVKNGFLIEHIDQLCMLKSSSMNPEVIRHLVGLNLSTIYSCCQVPSIKTYFLSPEFECVSIFKPYITSPYFEVYLHAKFILSSLSALLSDEEVDNLLQLTFEDQDSFFKALQVGITSKNRQVDCNTCSFSVCEALQTLKNLFVNRKNCEVIIRHDIIPSLVSLLVSGNTSEQKAGCELIWSCLTLETVGLKFKEQILANEISTDDYITPLLSLNSEELKMLADSILFCMDAKEEDNLRSLKYAEACYHYAHYSECIKLCEKLIKTLGSKYNINKTKYTMGKANFYVYQKMRFQLEKQKQAEKQHTKEYQEFHRRCYQIAKAVIGLLGSALDDGFLLSEEIKMLDIAMLDYIVNAKGNCGRCLLCHQKQKLRKSHYFPKALLETLSKGASKPLDQKIFRHNLDYYGPSKSARELYYEMFCSDCENLFSKHGETQFLPQFFLKIYDQSNPKQPTEPQDIKYGEWLHQFCIGLIFRGLAVQHQDIYINSDEIYNLFHECRRCLCHIDPKSFPYAEPISPENVKVAILVNPSETLIDEDTQPYMKTVLTSEVITYMNLQGPLDTDVISRPHQLHAFVVHFGMINVLVSIQPGKLNISSEYFINPEGGSFSVPADRDRGDMLPKGLWKAYQIKAIEYAANIINIPDRVAREFGSKKVQQPSELHQALFPIVSSQMKAAELSLAHVMPSSIPEVIKVANFLPDQFIIRPSYAPKSVSLPTGHRILVHRSYNLGEDSSDTIFLAVGSDDGLYSLDKPYALYHHYEPGLQLHYGSFVSPFTLEAQESLLDRKPKTKLKGTEFDVVENFRSVCGIKLSQILSEKGIANCMSLLKRVQSQIYSQSEMPSFDIKCAASKCWYCTELCEVCMKLASFGHTVQSSNGAILHFCSQSCQVFNTRNAQESLTTLQVWGLSESTPSQQFQARRIERNHKELLFMHMQGMLSSGQYCKVHLALCVGDGQQQYPKDKVYVVYYLRTLCEQQVLEFFLGEDLQPEEALSYGVTDTTEEAIARKRSTGEIQNLILMALSAKGYPNLHALL